ncbi:uncharacterized protein [Prorops nasuta]|uniref:uncharacterized protein isoform X2 n=1 Tax=Prorops nasuta TaxID=863751 RepID=UPI0034CE6035
MMSKNYSFMNEIQHVDRLRASLYCNSVKKQDYPTDRPKSQPERLGKLSASKASRSEVKKSVKKCQPERLLQSCSQEGRIRQMTRKVCAEEFSLSKVPKSEGKQNVANTCKPERLLQLYSERKQHPQIATTGLCNVQSEIKGARRKLNLGVDSLQTPLGISNKKSEHKKKKSLVKQPMSTNNDAATLSTSTVRKSFLIPPNKIREKHMKGILTKEKDVNKMLDKKREKSKSCAVLGPEIHRASVIVDPNTPAIILSNEKKNIKNENLDRNILNLNNSENIAVQNSTPLFFNFENAAMVEQYLKKLLVETENNRIVLNNLLTCIQSIQISNSMVRLQVDKNCAKETVDLSNIEWNKDVFNEDVKVPFPCDEDDFETESIIIQKQEIPSTSYDNCLLENKENLCIIKKIEENELIQCMELSDLRTSGIIVPDCKVEESLSETLNLQLSDNDSSVTGDYLNDREANVFERSVKEYMNLKSSISFLKTPVHKRNKSFFIPETGSASKASISSKILTELQDLCTE